MINLETANTLLFIKGKVIALRAQSVVMNTMTKETNMPIPIVQLSLDYVVRGVGKTLLYFYKFSGEQAYEAF